jgi:putative hydrolase of the HAD superfamily
MIKAVVFDVGGVLMFHEVEEIYKDISTYFGVSRDAVVNEWQELMPSLDAGSIDEATFWNQFQRDLKVSKPLPEQSLLAQSLRTTLKKNNEIYDFIASLRAQGLKLAVLSNTIEAHSDYLRKQKVYDGFDLVVLSHEVGLIKPNSDIYLHTLKRLGVSADEAVMVDDRLENIEAAQSIGMHGFVYRSIDEFKTNMNLLIASETHRSGPLPAGDKRTPAEF